MKDDGAASRATPGDGKPLGFIVIATDHLNFTTRGFGPFPGFTEAREWGEKNIAQHVVVSYAPLFSVSHAEPATAGSGTIESPNTEVE